jgi:hypothetical protein
VRVRPVLAVYGPVVPWAMVTLGEVDVICGRRLRWYLRHAGGTRHLAPLADQQAELIHAVAAQVLPAARPWRR